MYFSVHHLALNPRFSLYRCVRSTRHRCGEKWVLYFNIVMDGCFVGCCLMEGWHTAVTGHVGAQPGRREELAEPAHTHTVVHKRVRVEFSWNAGSGRACAFTGEVEDRAVLVLPRLQTKVTLQVLAAVVRVRQELSSMVAICNTNNYIKSNIGPCLGNVVLTRLVQP